MKRACIRFGIQALFYSAMTSTIILAPNLKLFWKIKQSVIVLHSRTQSLYFSNSSFCSSVMVDLSFLRSGRSAPAAFCILCKRMCRTRSARYFRIKILRGFSYQILLIDHFSQNNLLGSVADSEYREYSNHRNGYSSVPASYVPPQKLFTGKKRSDTRLSNQVSLTFV